VDGAANKRNTVLELHNNRLYVFYTPNGESSNSRCMVYHILYGIWESDDTRAYVGMTYASVPIRPATSSKPPTGSVC
jgi:hypothetical protein